MSKLQRITLAGKILWRVLFWSGLVSVIAGTGFGALYANNQGQVYLIVGLGFIFLGMALMVTGVLVSQVRIRIQKDRQSNVKDGKMLTLRFVFCRRRACPM